MMKHQLNTGMSKFLIGLIYLLYAKKLLISPKNFHSILVYTVFLELTCGMMKQGTACRNLL